MDKMKREEFLERLDANKFREGDEFWLEDRQFKVIRIGLIHRLF